MNTLPEKLAATGDGYTVSSSLGIREFFREPIFGAPQRRAPAHLQRSSRSALALIDRVTPFPNTSTECEFIYGTRLANRHELRIMSSWRQNRRGFPDHLVLPCRSASIHRS